MTTTTMTLPGLCEGTNIQTQTGFLKLIQLWHTRARQRKQLAHLTDEQLLDIGVTYERAMVEAAKPFWRE